MTWATTPPKTPVVCGHRGAMAVEPENTMASFRAAADRGATWVEFDVRPTKDGVIIIHHDPATADGVHLASANYADLDGSIPRLGELVETLPNLGLDIELKTDGTGRAVEAQVELLITEIDEHCASKEDLVVTSFDAVALKLVREMRPAIQTGLLFWDKPLAWALEQVNDAGHVAIGPWIKLLTAEVVDAARAAGLGIATWTVNDPEHLRLATDLGVDMIIGDDPAAIVDHLNNEG